MAKVYGPSGLITGKMGGGVYAIRNGVQIWRQYNPNVENPKSESQVEARAKLKLLSQLSAALKNTIAFRKQGIVSARNLFTRANYGVLSESVVTSNDLTAIVSLESLNLTGGVMDLPGMATPTISGNAVSVSLAGAASADVEKVLYALYGIKDDNRLVYIGTTVVENAGTGRTFTGSIEGTLPSEGQMIVYAYGMKFVTEAARTMYENYKTKSSTAEASLKVVKTLSEGDVALSVTKASVFPVA